MDLVVVGFFILAVAVDHVIDQPDEIDAEVGQILAKQMLCQLLVRGKVCKRLVVDLDVIQDIITLKQRCCEVMSSSVFKGRPLELHLKVKVHRAVVQELRADSISDELR